MEFTTENGVVYIYLNDKLEVIESSVYYGATEQEEKLYVEILKETVSELF